VKDVPGYFTADPKKDPEARQTPFLSYEDALELADHGCGLVQRQALRAAGTAGVPLVVGALDIDGGRTVIGGTVDATVG
jgi:aspartokinase